MSSHRDRDAAEFDAHGNTRPTGSNYITNDQSDDGVDRRGFLRCMAWAGTGVVWALEGGLPLSIPLSRISSLIWIRGIVAPETICLSNCCPKGERSWSTKARGSMRSSVTRRMMAD